MLRDASLDARLVSAHPGLKGRLPLLEPGQRVHDAGWASERVCFTPPHPTRPGRGRSDLFSA